MMFIRKSIYISLIIIRGFLICCVEFTKVLSDMIAPGETTLLRP